MEPPRGPGTRTEAAKAEQAEQEVVTIEAAPQINEYDAIYNAINFGDAATAHAADASDAAGEAELRKLMC